MDYKIKFEYKGIGKQASSIRQKVLQSQKSGDKKGGVSAGGARETISSLKTLNSSILKLIASNKSLERAIKSGGTGPGRRQPAVSTRPTGNSGLSSVGNSVPFIGAIVAATGWAITKINQIGKAHIALVSQQKSTVGVGGFRKYMSGSPYSGTELGAGMKQYGLATGKYETGELGAQEKTALGVGAIHGISAEEALGTAGQFKRANANYTAAVIAGTGYGIESELPTLLTGMASILTDAVKEGVNTSDLSKDMATEIAALTAASPGQSVDAALSVIKSFKGTVGELGKGKITGYQGLITAQANQSLFLKKMKDPKYRSQLFLDNSISAKQAGRFEDLYKGNNDVTIDDIATTNPKAFQYLLRKFSKQVGPVQLEKEVARMQKLKWGKDVEGKQGFSNLLVGTDSSLSTEAVDMMWGKKKPTEKMMEKGLETFLDKSEDTMKKGPMTGVKLQGMRDNLLLGQAGMARSAYAVEKAMISLASKISPNLNKAIEGITKAILDAGGTIGTAAAAVENSMNNAGSVMIDNANDPIF